MMRLTLSPGERRQLERLVERSRDAQQLRRAQGLLSLAEGEPVRQVIRRMRIGRSTLYEWVGRLRGKRHQPVASRLSDRPRPGRPAQKGPRLKARLETLMQQKPSLYGYRYAEWTTALLLVQLAAEGLQAGDSTVRRTLHTLGYRWKRPRFVLKRRSPTWRQAKGG